MAIYYTISDSVRYNTDPRMKDAIVKDHNLQQENFTEKKRQEDQVFQAAEVNVAMENWRDYIAQYNEVKQREDAREDERREAQKHQDIEQREEKVGQSMQAGSGEKQTDEKSREKEIQEKIDKEINRLDLLISKVNVDYQSARIDLLEKVATWHERTWPALLKDESTNVLFSEKTNANTLAATCGDPNAATVLDKVFGKDIDMKQLEATQPEVAREQKSITQKAKSALDQSQHAIREILGERRCSPMEVIDSIPGKREEFEMRYLEKRINGIEPRQAYEQSVMETVKSVFNLNDRIAVAANLSRFYKTIDMLSNGEFLNGKGAIGLAVKAAESEAMRAATDDYFKALIKSTNIAGNPHADIAELTYNKDTTTAALVRKKDELMKLSPSRNADLVESKLEQDTKLIDEASGSQKTTSSVPVAPTLGK